MENAVAAVIPAYNEEKRIAIVLQELKDYVDFVVVSDDGSLDKTAEIARRFGAEVVSSERNVGVGHATRLGCDHAMDKLGAKVIVLIDADGQHPPSKIPELLSALGTDCDFVFTDRFGDSDKMPLVKRLGNWGLSLATNFLSGTSIRDTQSGFRAFRTDAYRRMKLSSNGYEICSEFVLEVGRRGIRHCQIQIPANYDEWTKVKGTSVKTGLVIFWRLLGLAFSK